MWQHYSLAAPLTAALLGVLILGESLGAQEILGIGLIFTGITFLAIAPSK
jgi:drug/metabolite transporter (DMT)-like permease